MDERLASEKEKLHGPGILFASGLIAGEAIMGIGLAGMRTRARWQDKAGDLR